AVIGRIVVTHAPLRGTCAVRRYRREGIGGTRARRSTGALPPRAPARHGPAHPGAGLEDVHDPVARPPQRLRFCLIPTPPQCSAVSLSLRSRVEAAGHGVVAEANAATGQAPEAPVRLTATPQAPAAARHTVPLGWKPSAGQVALVPVQVSATSQAPAAARHT